jgi:hypothetical protein
MMYKKNKADYYKIMLSWRPKNQVKIIQGLALNLHYLNWKLYCTYGFCQLLFKHCYYLKLLVARPACVYC